MSTTTHRSKTRRRIRNWLLIPLGSIVALALIALGQLVLVAHALIWAAGFVFSMWAAGH